VEGATPEVPGGIGRRPSGPPGRLDDTQEVFVLEVSLDSSRDRIPARWTGGPLGDRGPEPERVP
jgi:hypothetical protein